MRSTRFLRMFTNFLSYKPFKSLPSLSITILVAFALSNFVLIILYETENSEKRFKALAQFFTVACLFTCIVKRITSPGNVTRIMDLIESELLEESRSYSHRSSKWQKIHSNYDEKRNVMERLYGKMKMITIMLLFGFIGRNVFGEFEENFKEWPTPYLYWCASGYAESPIFFVVVEVLYIVLFMFLLAEGFCLQLTTCLATERVLADFVTIYMLLDDLIKDFAELDSNFIIKQDGAFRRHVNLKKDMIIVIQCHQNLNRNFKQCADYSAYGSVISTVTIYADTVASTYNLLKMPRAYKRIPGSRRYADYSKDHLENCLNSIRSGKLTQRQAAEQFKIPRRTIVNKLKSDGNNRAGFPQVFSADEEKHFVKCILQFSDYGFPLDQLDLRMIVKIYLTRTGRTVSRFKNNIPGVEWARTFLKRHPELTTRFAANIKHIRASVNAEVLQSYICTLGESVKDVPPENIWNFDESNLTDNPGQKRVIVKRGSKYPEKICNSSKSSISLMFRGSAAGEFLPPYVAEK